MQEKIKLEFIPKTVTDAQIKDSGMAFVLIALLVVYFTGQKISLTLPIGLLLLNMIWPQVYRIPAKLWLGLSIILGTFVSTILLTIVFYVLVTPVGLLRRVLGADSLRLKQWKRDRSSVFNIRNCTFTARDIKKPY